MRIRTVAARVLAWSSLCAAAGYAQSEIRLLDLDVVALDSHGQPVTDLTADDFQITDAGKPQKFVFFRKNDERGEPSRSQADVRAQFSNRANQRRHNAIVILFDLLNMGYGTRSIAANNLVRDLSAFRPADNLYLYLLSVNGKFFTVHGISPGESSNPQTLGKPWTTQIKPLMDLGMRAVKGFRTPDMDVFLRTQVTFASLVALGEQLEAVPGRKIIVWVTDGAPVALGENRSDTGFPIDFTPQIRELSQALERSHIAPRLDTQPR